MHGKPFVNQIPVTRALLQSFPREIDAFCYFMLVWQAKGKRSWHMTFDRFQQPRNILKSFLFVSILLCAAAAYGISLKDIEAVPGQAPDPGILESLRKSESAIAGLAVMGSDSNRYDSLAGILRQSYQELHSDVQGKPDLKSNLTSGLILLYLGELGNKSSYDTAKSLLEKSLLENPGNSTAVWMEGLHLIKSGDVLNGIRLLDSLRQSGFNSSAFLMDYARYSFQALVPQKADSSSLVFKNFFTPAPDTLSPSSNQWSVIRFNEPNKTNGLPSFTFGATFDIHKPFHLVFKGLPQQTIPSIAMGNAPDAAVEKSLNYQFATRKGTAFCRLYVDLSDSKTSLADYLYRRINGIYDSVSVRNDLREAHGTSLRCYNRPRLSNEDEGKFTAIASFDRRLSDIQKYPGRQFSSASLKTVRYTVVVQAPAGAEELSEAKFQAILRALL
jgi:hypothetical protein